MALAAEHPAVGDDAGPAEGVSLAGLMEKWNDCDVIRSQVLQKQSLLQWPSLKHVGVINFSTLAHNARVMAKVLEVWCPQLETPKTVWIDHVRDEAGAPKNLSNSNGWNRVCLRCAYR